MDQLLSYSAAVLLLLVTACGWVLTMIGMPGNWLIVLAAAAYCWLGPTEGNMHIGWQMVVGLVVLALIGELLELAASMWGTRRAGGSRRAAVLSVLGSIAGAIVGAIIGAPIPVIGSLIAALLGGAIGALAGAAFAEHTHGETPDQALRVGAAAFWGRLWGTGAKTAIATLLVLGVVVALFS